MSERNCDERGQAHLMSWFGTCLWCGLSRASIDRAHISRQAKRETRLSEIDKKISELSKERRRLLLEKKKNGTI